MVTKVVAIIPAHLASVRFPRKVLFPFHRLPMIEHVRRRALLSRNVSEVHVATCDQEVADVVRGFGGSVIMTAATHRNGTSRVAEASAGLDCTHVILLQGDEPLLLPRHVDSFVDAIAAEPGVDAWNAIGELDRPEELDRHSFVKCAVAPSGRILLCFRRTPCYSEFSMQRTFIRKILGLIAFRRDFLLQLTELDAVPMEEAELIEQMRIISHGFELRGVEVSPTLPSVNEPEEAETVLEYIRRDEEQRSLLSHVLATRRVEVQ